MTYRILVLLAALSLVLGASACGTGATAVPVPEAMLTVIPAVATIAEEAPAPDPAVESADEPAAACLTVTQEFVELLANSLTIAGGGGIARAAAMSVEVSDDDQSEWWLVAAELTGAGMDGTIGVWVTGSDPTTGASGPIFSADGIAAEFSEWGQPPDVARRFTMFDEDVRAAKGCIGE